MVRLIDPAKEEEVVVAFIEKMLEMEAVTPDEEAISKKASGLVSPKPNLPREVETNLAKEAPPDWTIKSLLKVHSPVMVWEILLEAGPLVQLSLMKASEAVLDKAN